MFAAITAGTELATDIETGFLNRLQLTPLRRVAILVGQMAGRHDAGAARRAGLPRGRHRRRRRHQERRRRRGRARRSTRSSSPSPSPGSARRSARAPARPRRCRAPSRSCSRVFFLSSMSLPRDLIAVDWFRTVATWNPASYLIEGLRSLVITGWDGTALWRGVGRRRRRARALVLGGLARAGDEDGADMTRRLPAPSPAAVLRRNLIHAFKNPALLVPSIVFPLLFLVAFAGGLSNVANVPGLRLPVGLHGLPVRLRLPAVGGLRRRLHRLRDRGRLRVGLRPAPAARRPAARGDHRRLRAGGHRALPAHRRRWSPWRRCSPGMQVDGNPAQLVGAARRSRCWST